MKIPTLTVIPRMLRGTPVLTFATVVIVAIVTQPVSGKLRPASEIEVTQDCRADTNFYYFIGEGIGPTKAIASQGALLDGRRNAIVCLFESTVKFESTIKESPESVESTSVTSIATSAENIDWSEFDMATSEETESKGQWSAKIQFRWSRKVIDKMREKEDALLRERERNRALAAQVAEAKKLADERAAILKKQKEEIDRHRKAEIEIEKIASTSDKLVAKMMLRKKLEREKDDQWLDMVKRFGCGVTLSDLEAILGPPKSKQVWNQARVGSRQTEYTPLMRYEYGNFALYAPVADRSLNVPPENSWTKYADQADQYQITSVVRNKGTKEKHEICKN